MSKLSNSDYNIRNHRSRKNDTTTNAVSKKIPNESFFSLNTYVTKCHRSLYLIKSFPKGVTFLSFVNQEAATQIFQIHDYESKHIEKQMMWISQKVRRRKIILSNFNIFVSCKNVINKILPFSHQTL